MNQYLLLVLGLGAIVAVAEVNQEKVVHLAADHNHSQVLAEVKESNYVDLIDGELCSICNHSYCIERSHPYTSVKRRCLRATVGQTGSNGLRLDFYSKRTRKLAGSKVIR